MSRIIRSDDLLDVLVASGVLSKEDNATRVVIDLRVGQLPVVHVEKYGDERMLELVRALEGVEIRRGGEMVPS